MDVMQTLADFKQNLHSQAKLATGGVGAERSQSTAKPGVPAGAATLAAPIRSAASTAPATATTGSNSTTITANDFLQLLVAEMKNQDPTANQDPNAYIDQLVQVNSLQQLISINQDLIPVSSTAASAAVATRQALPPGNAGAVLGTAVGTPSASVALSLAPPETQPQAAPVARAGSGLPSGESVNAETIAAQVQRAELNSAYKR